MIIYCLNIWQVLLQQEKCVFFSQSDPVLRVRSSSSSGLLPRSTCWPLCTYVEECACPRKEKVIIRLSVAEWIARRTHNPRVVGSTPVHGAGCILGKGTWALFPRLPRGALNRGAVCVRMHLRSCTDVKEPGWPSESLGVQKQTDRAGMHKRPEDGMWLPTGGQIGNGHIRVSSLAQGERCRKQARPMFAYLQDFMIKMESLQPLHLPSKMEHLNTFSLSNWFYMATTSMLIILPKLLFKAID